MLVVGLTGGIGSGKSTVAKLFAKRGVTIIDTDQIARNVTQIGTTGLAKIVEHFDFTILYHDGTLDRTKLRKIIFDDKNERLWLEDLLHPLIRDEMKKEIDAALSDYCVVNIPLLLETKKNPLIDRILVVDATEAEQIKRTQQRDNLSIEEIKAIIATQVSRSERLAAANDVIENTGSYAELIPQVDRLHGMYTALAESK